MKHGAWLKTLGAGMLVGASATLNPHEITLDQQAVTLSPLEKNLMVIGQDTTFRNSVTLKGLSNEYNAWYEILNRKEDETIVYDRDNFSIIDILPTKFAKSQEQINSEILDSIRSRQSWDYASRLRLDIPFRVEQSQKDIDRALLEELHIKHTGEKMPAWKSRRPIGMRFGKRHIITDAIERMAPYLDHYLSELKKNDLPPSLLTIPVLESSFNPKAVSWAGAVGQFQFMYSAAKDYNLPMSRVKIEGTRVFDYRKHPIVAFDAFVSFMDNLIESSEEFSFIAPMKYNTGPNRSYYKNITSSDDAINVIKERGFAPRSYVPEMMAIGTILQEMVEKREWFNFKYDDIHIATMPKQIRPSQIEEELGLHPDIFFTLNPQYVKTTKDIYVLSKGMPYISLK